MAAPRVSRVRFFTTPWRQSKTQRVRVFTKTRPPPTRHPKRNVWVSSPQRGSTPKPRVRLPGPVGRGAAPWGVDDSAIATVNGVEQNAVSHKSRPDSSPGWNGGRAWGDVDGWGHVGLVAPRWGACSTPHASPGFGPHALRRGGRTLGRRRFGDQTPTGLNKMRSPTKHGPIRPRVGMGDVRVVTRSDGATSVLSHPVGVHARRRTHPQGSAPHLAAGGPNPGLWGATTLW